MNKYILLKTFFLFIPLFLGAMNSSTEINNFRSLKKSLSRSSLEKKRSNDFCTLPGKEQHPNKETRRYYSDLRNSNGTNSKS